MTQLVTNRRRISVAAALGLLGAGLCVLSLGTGDYPVSPADVLRALAGQDSGVGAQIITELRLPRVLTAAMVGAGLGAAGAVFQSITANPLASPDVIGFNYGAASGALSVIVLGSGSPLTVALAALAGGLVTAATVYLLSLGPRARGRMTSGDGYSLILIGIAIGAMLAAFNAYLLVRANIVSAQDAFLWLTGSLDGRGWGYVVPLAVSLAVLLPAVALAVPTMRVLELGDDLAAGLGVRVGASRFGMVALASALAAVAVAAAGPVLFVALAAPLLTRALTARPGPDPVLAALTGAVLMLAADFLAQHALPSTRLPVGVVTGALGGVFLIAVLSHRRVAQ